MSPALTRVLERFPDARKAGNGWSARCPAHEDQHPSLSISAGAKGVVLHCHTGCPIEAILAAVGLETSDLFDDDSARKKPHDDIVSTHDYCDEHGEILYQVCRTTKGGKGFFQRRPNGRGGWTNGLGDSVRRVPYGLDRIARDRPPKLLIVEGEKDCETLWALNLPATCNVGGAGKWLSAYTEDLIANGCKTVIILPDNDTPGKKHANDIAASVIAASTDQRPIAVKIVLLPGLQEKGDVTDWMMAGHTEEELRARLNAAVPWPRDGIGLDPGHDPDSRSASVSAPPRIFSALEEGGYQLAIGEGIVTLGVTRLRRERHELAGELRVTCRLPGARTIAGDVLSIGTFNLSSVTARKQRATLLEDQSKADGLGWPQLLEDFCQRVIDADRSGQPSIVLRDCAPEIDERFDLHGLKLPRHHPAVIFGDGGSLKSYLLLYLLGELEGLGYRTALFDWELDPGTHRNRLGRLFGADLPGIRYVRCERPLVYEADRLRQIVCDERLTYLGYDSAGFATNGPPEGAEQALEFFRCVRQIGPPCIVLAHINRSEQGDQRPFGSVFWGNSPRALWHVKASEAPDGDRTQRIALFDKKENLGAKQAAGVGFAFEFIDGQTLVRRVSVADIEDLADKLPLWQRMRQAVSRGPVTLATLAEELGAKVDTLDRYVRRYPQTFTRVDGADGISRVALTPHVDPDNLIH